MREAGGTVAESVVGRSSTRKCTVARSNRVSKHQIQRGWRAAQSLTSQGSAEPLCPRIKGTNREVSEVKADL